MNILYVGEVGKSRFMGAIAQKWSECNGIFAHRVEEPYACLDGQEGIVLVGRQHRVFSPRPGEKYHPNYFNFLREVQCHGMGIAAVLDQGDSLPGGNQYIDLAVERRGYQTPINSIARQLRRFFSSKK